MLEQYPYVNALRELRVSIALIEYQSYKTKLLSDTADALTACQTRVSESLVRVCCQALVLGLSGCLLETWQDMRIGVHGNGDVAVPKSLASRGAVTPFDPSAGK